MGHKFCHVLQVQFDHGRAQYAKFLIRLRGISFIQKELCGKFYPLISHAKSARDGKSSYFNNDQQGNLYLDHRCLKMSLLTVFLE